MSLEDGKSAARKLSAQERRTLGAFKRAVSEQINPTFTEEMARRIDDNTPGHWFTIEDLDRRFGLAS